MYADGPCNQGMSLTLQMGQDPWYNGNVTILHLGRQRTCMQMCMITGIALLVSPFLIFPSFDEGLGGAQQGRENDR